MGLVTKDITEGNRVFQGLDIERSMALEKKEESGTIRVGKALLRKEEFAPFFSASLFKLGHLISSYLALGLGFIPLAPPVLRPLDSD